MALGDNLLQIVFALPWKHI